jgi:multimeric flavodoxin WrbA
MTDPKKALLVLGSPRGQKSASYSLGGYLLDSLANKGMATDEIWLFELVNKPEGDDELFQRVISSDIIILACPLYIDSLPAIVTKALTMLNGKYKTTPVLSGKRMMAIINCGFPETSQNDVAVEICRNFARSVGMNWLGALAMGMGGAIGGKPLKEAGGAARNAVKALDISAQALAENKPLPDSAIALMGKNPIPGWLYTFIGDHDWKRTAKKYGVRKLLKAKPYAKE